jgi:hypothetical protein
VFSTVNPFLDETFVWACMGRLTAQTRRVPARAVPDRVPAGDRVGLRGLRIGARPNFTGLASLGLEIGIFCDSLYSVVLLGAVLGLDF